MCREATPPKMIINAPASLVETTKDVGRTVIDTFFHKIIVGTAVPTMIVGTAVPIIS